MTSNDLSASVARVACLGLLLVGGFAGRSLAGGVTHDIKLPPETAVLKPSPLPGYQIATQKCGICHSVDYINLQPPQMSLAQWTAEMNKMQHAYGAPIDDAEIKLLGIYLASTYGDSSTVTPEDRGLTLPTSEVGGIPETPPGATAVIGAVSSANSDARTILDRNACLNCHALQTTVVGPAYHDIAIKYKHDEQAQAKIAASIRAGGAGKWGPIAMPPFPDLSAQELQVLAAFVLEQ